MPGIIGIDLGTTNSLCAGLMSDGPTAAALTYGFHDRDAKRRLIVIDLGRGTFDVTAMVVFEGTLEFYPRDNVRNQHLVLYAERIIREVIAFQREAVETVLDELERAMASGERDWLELARQDLLTKLSALGFPYDTSEGPPA